MSELGSCEGFPIEKVRHQVHPLQLSKYDGNQIWTYWGTYPTKTDLDRLYRRLELAEYFMENIKIDDSDFPLFMEWRQLKEENFAEYLEDGIHSSVPTGNYFKDEQAV